MIALFDNYNKALEYQTAETNSAGLATERYNTYLQSVAASAERMKSAWQDVWATTINSGAIKFFYDASTAIAEFIKSIGGLTPLIGTLVSALVALKATSIVESITDLIGMFKSLSISVQSSIAAINNSLIQHEITATETATVVSTTTGEEIASFEDLQISAVSGLNNVDGALVTTGTTAKITAAGIVGALGIIITALMAVVMAYQTYQSQVVERQQEGLKNNADAWKSVFDNVNQNGATSANVLKSFADGITAIRDAYNNANPIARLFVDQQGMVNQGLETTIAELKSTSTSWNDYINNVRQAAEAAGYQVDADGRLYTATSGSRGMVKVYNDALTNLIGTQNNYKNGAADTTKVQQANTQATQAQTDAYQGLDTALKDLDASEKAVLDIKKLTFDDVQKLIAANKDYAGSVDAVNGKLVVNTDALNQQVIAQAEAAVQAAKNANASKNEINILQAYVDQLKNAAAETKTYSDNFTQMLNATYGALGAQQAASGGFTKLGNSLSQMNNEFKTGKLTADQYFQGINNDLKEVDFSQMFAKNKQAAQTFFAGLTLDATQALGQINAAFNAGDMDVVAYDKALTQISSTFEYIGGIVKDFGTQMGMTASEISSITNSMSGITQASQQLAQSQQLNIDLEGMMADQAKGTLDTTSASYKQALMNIANAGIASQQTFHDAQGNVLTSAQGIYNYISGGAANLNDFANQAANNTGKLVQTILQDIGHLLVDLGSAISSMHIVMTADVQTTEWDFPGGSLQLPTGIQFNFGMSGGGNIASEIASVVTDLGKTLEGTSNNWDSSIYTMPSAINQVTGAAGDAAGAVNDLGSALTAAANAGKSAASDLKSQLDAAKTAAEDALNAQLAGYKGVIDARKALLDSLQAEKTYNEDIANQNKGISDIQNKLTALQFDQSDAANAERLSLQDELANAQQKLSDTESKQSTDVQKAALDADYAAFEGEIKAAVDNVKGINATSMADLANQLSRILATIAQPPAINPATLQIPSFHQGAEVGFVGQYTPSQSSEMLAQLMKGELVLTPNQMNNFMIKTLPQISSQINGGGGQVSIGNLINIEGNADASTVVDLQQIADNVIDQLNNVLQQRGKIRLTGVTAV